MRIRSTNCCNASIFFFFSDLEAWIRILPTARKRELKPNLWPRCFRSASWFSKSNLFISVVVFDVFIVVPVFRTRLWWPPYRTSWATWWDRTADTSSPSPHPSRKGTGIPQSDPEWIRIQLGQRIWIVNPDSGRLKLSPNKGKKGNFMLQEAWTLFEGV